MQPKRCIMDFDELNGEELTNLGPNIKRIIGSLKRYWEVNFPEDKLKRVYVVYLFEGVFDIEPEKYHLHIHLIPRTVRIGQLLRMFGEGNINAWAIYKSSGEQYFPKYLKSRRYDGKVEKLMDFLRAEPKERK